VTAAIEIRSLTKNFGRVRALDGLDVTVEPGEIHGFLGPNGAGKSTTLRILLGLIHASGGEACVFGHDVWSEAPAVHERVAYVPGDVNLWPNLSGGEAIDLVNRLRGAPLDAAYRQRRDALIEVFRFDPTKRARSYSKGNRQKVALIAALSTPADLYLLDEPTSGLDPLMERVFSEQVRTKHAEGATVLLSSHILSEVQQLAQRVTIIRDGRTVETGSLADLRHLTRTEFTMSADGLHPATLRALPQVHGLNVDANVLRFTAEQADVDDLLPALAAMHVRDLTISPPSLEELFLRLYGDPTDDREAAGAR
jgi:ABC-2 type transport system ATP-binding protein